MSDVFATIDPDRLALLCLIVAGTCALAFGVVMAACIIALHGPNKSERREFTDPDPFLAPGSHNGLRVGPPPARARSGQRTTGPGTPFGNRGNRA